MTACTRWAAAAARARGTDMPGLIEDPTPTEELPLPRGDATVRIPDGEAGLRAARLRLEALERAIRLHQRATSHPRGSPSAGR
jgi:uncharacterized protein involved in type VI secretion and phage assembly